MNTFADRTVATFESDAFNCTESKDYFINPECYGDDLAKFLMEKLQLAGHSTAEAPGQEDFGWYFDYEVSGDPFTLVIGRTGDPLWFVQVERRSGFLASLTGSRNRKIPQAGVQAIHSILSTEPEFSNTEWFSWKQFSSDGPDMDQQENPDPSHT